MSGQTTVIKSQKTELNRTIEELEAALRAKEEVKTLGVLENAGISNGCFEGLEWFGGVFCVKFLNALEIQTAQFCKKKKKKTTRAI